MASVAYQQWVNAGRPLTPARPVRDVVDRMKVAYPKAAAKNIFSWYANEAHYTAVPPQDHTPFSATGWPGVSPRWYVFATDIMHRVDLGVDCNVLFPYWLKEAKAGRFPSLKYIIWQARLYSVQNNWNSQANSDHFDHIHLSFRTDFRDTPLGSWSLIPGGNQSQGDDVARIFQFPAGAYWLAKGDGTRETIINQDDMNRAVALYPGAQYPGVDEGKVFPAPSLDKLGWTEDKVDRLIGRKYVPGSTGGGGGTGGGVSAEQVQAIVHQELAKLKMVSDVE